MKKLSKNTGIVLFRLCCLIVVFILILIIPTFSLGVNDNLDRIYSIFAGDKIKYNGMIEIWNIDTFEGGTKSKTTFLNSVAINFQKKYRGVYVLVRNITEQECENMLMQGQKPDLFSCSYGFSLKIKDYLQPYSIQSDNLYANLLEAGKDNNGNLYGIAWCLGLYYLISTKENLSKAGVEYCEGCKLIDNAFSLGYIKTGKKNKNIYSLTFANKGYYLSKNVISSYYDNGANLISNLSFNSSNLFSQYDAYIDFLVGNSVMLLGSQRDVFRIKNRESNGKIQDVLIEPILTNSDLVQFIFMSKNEDEIKIEYTQKFVSMLTSVSLQNKLADYGLFSTIKNLKLSYENVNLDNISTEDIAGLKINNIFYNI